MNRPSKVVYEFHEFRIDPEKRLLLRNEKPESISPKMFDTLLLLVRMHTRVVTEEELRNEVWHGLIRTKNNINVHISKIRKALGQSRQGHRCIETIEGHGYRFACEVRKVANETVDPLLEQPVRPIAITHKGAAPEELQSLRGQDILAESTNGGQIVAIQADETVSITASKARRLSHAIGHYKFIIPAILLVLFAAAFMVFPKWIPYIATPKPEPPPSISHPGMITKDGRTKTGPLITDGSRLYFSEIIDENKVPFQALSTGGEIGTIIVPFLNTILLDISPDQTELLIGSQPTIETEMQLWVVPVLGGSPRSIGDLRAHAGCWSPDGTHIVYANGSKLYLANRDGSDSRELVEIPAGLPYSLRWSPDGSLLRFEVQDTQTRSTSLWEVKADGTNLHALLPEWNNTATECCGNWTADGRYFIFQATRNGRTTIWAIRENTVASREAGYEPIQLIEGVTSYCSPVISKNGKKLFVISELKRGELVRYEVKTKQWVRYLGGISADNLDFSSDGQWIVYVTYPEGELWKSRVDGSERRQLTFPPLLVHYPQWSPDGKRISFTAIEPGKGWKIYLMSAEGGNPEPLMPEDDNGHGTGWSPDGNTLVFWKGERSLGKTAIYLLDLKTKTVSELPGSKGLFAPRWSPKGDYIAAVPSKDGKGLMLYDLNSRVWKELVNMNITFPSWSRDGKHIYFRSFDQNDPAVFRVRIHDRKSERWATLKDIQGASGAFGPWMGMAPDGSVLVLRDTGIQNIYAFDLQSP